MTHPATSQVTVGNAFADGAGDTRGWFVGHFIEPPASLRCTDAVEVKWGVHAAGESRHRMAMGTESTTLSMLVRGMFRVSFSDREVCLGRPGDYVLFPPGVLHGWVAEADSIVVTIRWPSKPGDAIEAP
jgi:hypothetical protein